MHLISTFLRRLRALAPATIGTATLMMSFVTPSAAVPIPILNSAMSRVKTPQNAIVQDRVTIRVNELDNWNTAFTLFVLAGQTVELCAVDPLGRAQLWEGDGEFVPKSPARGTLRGPLIQGRSPLTWKAPGEPGRARVSVQSADPDRGWIETASLDILVMVPATELKQGLINGYRIGRYPAPKPESPVPYIPPPGFARVPGPDSYTPISPRFALEDFACKQGRNGERYLYLDQRLPQFLEAIADRVSAEGFEAGLILFDDEGPGLLSPTTGIGPQPEGARRAIHILSGYRTPAYNRTLGTVLMSRHMYGDAADIYIDCDGDGSMDDLNRDGRIDGDDAITLAKWIEDVWTKPQFEERPGGLGIYNATKSHGPFVHVDLRGKKARWGGNGLSWDEDEPNSASETLN